ncbi:MAG: MBL fold metallo-hydrolase, partial [Cytophagaceae bacterium]
MFSMTVRFSHLIRITQFFGGIRVDSVTEFDHWAVEPAWLLGGVTHEQLAEHLTWLGPKLVEAETGKLLMRSHAYLIRTPHHTVLFDTCCGNDKDRGGVFPLHQRMTPFLENLASAGVTPEQVDYVMCSHLHVDHVGWNTVLRNGEWVPTFPNARYLVSRGEYAWWSKAVKAGEGSEATRAAFSDSVLPIFQRGLAVLVDDNHMLGNEFPDEIRYMPLHGHTPHLCGLYLRSRNVDAVLTGDTFHHPIQIARPDWVFRAPGSDHE